MSSGLILNSLAPIANSHYLKVCLVVFKKSIQPIHLIITLPIYCLDL